MLIKILSKNGYQKLSSSLVGYDHSRLTPRWKNILVRQRQFQKRSIDLSFYSRSAIILPRTGLNLKPWPEQGDTARIFSFSSVQSRMKSQLLVKVKQHFYIFIISSTSPLKYLFINYRTCSIFFFQNYQKFGYFFSIEGSSSWTANLKPSPPTSGRPQMGSPLSQWDQAGRLPILYLSPFFIFQKDIVCLTGLRIFSRGGTSLPIHLPQVSATFLANTVLVSFLVFNLRVTPLELFSNPISYVSSQISIFLHDFRYSIIQVMQFQALMIPAFLSKKTGLSVSILGAEGKSFLVYSSVNFWILVDELATARQS